MNDTTTKPEAASPEASDNAAPIWPEAHVDLDHPIPDGKGGEIKRITFREPDVEALETMEELELVRGEPLKIRHLRIISAALSRLPNETIKKINSRDFTRLAEALAPFLEAAGGEDRS